MPSLNNITVHVVTGRENNPLKEWGVQHIRGKKKISAYIQAETDVAFKISIRPKMPWVASDSSVAHDYDTSRRAYAPERGEEPHDSFKVEDEWDFDNEENGVQRPYDGRRLTKESNEGCGHRRSDFHHDTLERAIKRESDDEFISPSSPLRSIKKSTRPPPFDFLASLYLDGRKKPERKNVLYLDPQNEDFNYPSGEILMKTRWTQGGDGILKEHAWVFKDVGIETMFDKMLISGDVDTTAEIEKDQEDAIIAAMNATSFDLGIDVAKEEKSKVGQILVELQRIRLGEKWRDPNFRAKHTEREMQDVNMNEANNEITHTAGFKHTKTLESNSIRVVPYIPYREGEGIYASFQFFYRSKEKLAKFRFAGFNDPTPTSILSSGVANFYQNTPLSITYGSRSISKPNSIIGMTFKDKIGKRYVLGEEGSDHRYTDHHWNLETEGKKNESAFPEREIYQHKSLITDSSVRPECKKIDTGIDPTLLANQTKWPHLHNLQDPPPSPASSENSGLSVLKDPLTSTLPETLVSLDVSESTVFTPPSSKTIEDLTSTLNHFKPASRLKISNLALRGVNVSSDADDEYDPSDLETHADSDTDRGYGEMDGGLACRDLDDQGLSTKVGQLNLGKRGREHSRDDGVQVEHKKAETPVGSTLGNESTLDDTEQLRVKRTRKSSEDR